MAYSLRSFANANQAQQGAVSFTQPIKMPLSSMMKPKGRVSLGTPPLSSMAVPWSGEGSDMPSVTPEGVVGIAEDQGKGMISGVEAGVISQNTADIIEGGVAKGVGFEKGEKGGYVPGKSMLLNALNMTPMAKAVNVVSELVKPLAKSIIDGIFGNADLTKGTGFDTSVASEATGQQVDAVTAAHPSPGSFGGGGQAGGAGDVGGGPYGGY
jgi:hypothetical protein